MLVQETESADMDRDQVNCIHYLYQGDPARRLPDAMLFSGAVNPPLIWCDFDTVGPLEYSGVLHRDGDGVTLPLWCLQFIDQVEGQLRQLPNPNYAFGYPFSARIRKAGEPRPAFLAIPYRPQFDAVKSCVLEACQTKNFRCEITGDLSIPGNIMDQVWHGIRGSDIVIADITGGNPNVLFEMGLSAALGKEVIIVGEQEALPFDIAHSRKITYSRAKLDELKQELVAALASISARYPFEGPEPRF
jgi:hypothetical protein